MGLTRPRYSSIQDTDYKQSVRVATTEDVGNLLATGNMTNTVDDVELVVNDRILVKDQSDAKQNGIYFVIDAGTGSNGTWRRSLDADASFKVTSGLTATVVEGSANTNKTFKLSTPDPITLGTSDLTFVNPFVVTATAGGSVNQVQFNDAGGVLGGASGLTFNKTSNLLAVSGNVSARSFVGNLITDNSGLVDGEIFAEDAILNIASGSSNIRIYSSDNIAVSSNGVANVVVIGANSTTLTGNLLPSANLTYNLGSPTQRWATGYFAGNTLDLGGAQISVDSTTGTFTFTGGGISTDLGGTSTFNPAGDATIGGNLIVTGDLFIAGNTTTFSTNNVVFNDALIYLAKDNPTDFLDIGSVGNFTRSSLFQHTGLVRDATDGVWKLFEGVEPIPTTTVDFGSASYSTALLGNLVTRSNITVGGNLRLGGALLTSAGLGGTPGQFLTSTGTNLAWVDLDVSSDSISDGDTNVTAANPYVTILTGGTSTANFNFTTSYIYSGLNVSSDVTANAFIGDGSQLTGLPESYSNVQVATYLPTYSGNISAANVNVSGNLTVRGNVVLTQVEAPYVGENSIIRTNATTIAANITIPSGTNGMSAGPITIASGVTVTIAAGGEWSIV
jgi:hypothetical protein